MPGGKFNLSKPKTEIEWVQKRSKESPGPSDYADFSLKSASDRSSGGKISTAKPKSETEILMLRSAETPGPGQYTPISVFLEWNGIGSLPEF